MLELIPDRGHKRLSRVQTEEYRCGGVLFALPVLTNEELERYRKKFDEWSGAAGGRLTAYDFRHPHLFQRWAYDLALTPAVLDAVEDVIGPDILIHSTTMFCKYPGDRTYVSWHQDGYYLGLSSFDFVSAWIALTESSLDNGCMQVVRGSHLAGRADHAESSRSPDNLLPNGMEITATVRDRDATAVILRAGEMSLHHVNIVHGSRPNESNRFRIGFAVRYVSPRVRQEVNHTPAVLARGDDRYGHFRRLRNPPDCGVAESIRRQKALHKWVIAARAGADVGDYPREAGLECL